MVWCSGLVFWSVFGAVGELDQAAVEEMCGGNFIDLRKAFFLLTGAEAPLVAKVGNYICPVFITSVLCLLHLSCVYYICPVFTTSVLCLLHLSCVYYICRVFTTSVLCLLHLSCIILAHKRRKSFHHKWICGAVHELQSHLRSWSPLCPAGSGSAALASNQQLLQCHGPANPPQPGRKSEGLQRQRHHLLSQGTRSEPDLNQIQTSSKPDLNQIQTESIPNLKKTDPNQL